MDRANKKIKVLIVDDSALVRQILQFGLSQDPIIEIVGSAKDPYEARDKIVQLRPDVLTLDVEMPKMDGVKFLKQLMPQYPMPVVMVSALTEKGKKITLDALEAGAVDFVTKPTVSVSQGLGSVMAELAFKIKIAAKANVSHWKKPPVRRVGGIRTDLSGLNLDGQIIAIGASTGGTEAIKKILKELPVTIPGIVIVQHMPPGYVDAFARNVDSQCEIKVREAKDNEIIKPGCALIAPGGQHMEIVRESNRYLTRVFSGEKVNGHCPSVDVLMESVALVAKDKAYGVLLTGMGHDGANGLLRMHQTGANTFAQNEETCIVYGMPRVANEKGAVKYLLPIDEIAPSLLKSIAI